MMATAETPACCFISIFDCSVDISALLTGTQARIESIIAASRVRGTEAGWCHGLEWSENILCGGRQIIIWRPPHKLSGGRHIKYSHSILVRGTNGLPY